MTWPHTPSHPGRKQAFDACVLRAVERAEVQWQTPLDHVEIGVEDVPPSEPSSWEEVIPLGRAFPAEGKAAPRIIVYRLPISSRVSNQHEREVLVDHVVRAQLAAVLGRSLDED